MNMNTSKKAVIVIFAAAMVLAALAVVILSQKQATSTSLDESAANAKPWYGRYWEFGTDAEKLIQIDGDKVILSGEWENASEQYGDVKPEEISKTFTLTDATKYYFNDTNAEEDPIKEVTREEFEENLYTDLCNCSFNVKNGKVIEAYLAFN